MKIGILGLEFGSGNKGCEALAFSFFSILDTLAAGKKAVFNVLIFMECDVARILKIGKYQQLQINVCRLGGFGSVKKIKNRLDRFSSCDIIFDFTAGDSFSDIYGMERFIRGTLTKQFVIWSKTRFVLGSQTYGPFSSRIAKNWAAHIIKKTDYVISRDALSTQYILDLTGRKPIETADIAFILPYETVSKTGKKIKVGINASGLLWMGGYTGGNQFNLSVDYQEYCKSLISRLIEMKDYELFLIPHAGNQTKEGNDNDVVACRELKRLFSKVNQVEMFGDPIEAKSFISGMDVFIGARMHAAVAALSSGVVTIPTAYSRKFNGVFQVLNYNHVVDLKELTTKDAVEMTIRKIQDFQTIKQDVNNCLNICDQVNQHTKSVYSKILFGD